MRTIFDLIIKFQTVLDDFFSKAISERDYRVHADKQSQESVSIWKHKMLGEEG